MNRHLTVVAGGFQVAGFGLGLPSLALLLFFGYYAVQLRLATPHGVSQTPYTSDKGLNLIVFLGRVFGSFFTAIGNGGQWLVTVLSVVFFVLLMLSILLIFTGRGLQAHQAWARIAGLLLSGGALLPSLGGALLVRRGLLAVIAVSVFAGSAYTLWCLSRRFS